MIGIVVFHDTVDTIGWGYRVHDTWHDDSEFFESTTT